MKYLLTDWLKRIDENFEKEFWIDSSDSSTFVNRHEIYKDTVNSSLQWTDFQFRPNFLVAAVLVSHSPLPLPLSHLSLSLSARRSGARHVRQDSHLVGIEASRIDSSRQIWHEDTRSQVGAFLFPLIDSDVCLQ